MPVIERVVTKFTAEMVDQFGDEVPKDLAPADRQRLAVTAGHGGDSPEDALASTRRRPLSALAARREARRTALLAREVGTASSVERRLQN